MHSRADRFAAADVLSLPVSRPPRGRDLRIDVLRGLALVMIFVNHVPGTVFENFTSRNFGFSDAAEGFVMISGISAGLAFGRGFVARPYWPGVQRAWGRAWQLYLVHLLLSLWTLWVVAATLRFGGAPELLGRDQFEFLVRDPIGVFLGLPALTHQFGYVNILPLYAVLMLAAPLAIWAGLRWPGRVLAVSVALWVLAGLTQVNLPLTTMPGGWFLNPLSWQLIFVVGLLIGLRLRHGKRFVPVRRWALVLAGGYLLLSLVWLQWPALMKAGNAALGDLANLGVPSLFRDFNKTFETLPRLLHILALSYVLSALPGLRDMCASRALAPLALMGRHALPVFALGTVLAFGARALRELAPVPSVALDAALLALGLVLLMGLAGAVDLAGRRREPMIGGSRS